MSWSKHCIQSLSGRCWLHASSQRSLKKNSKGSDWFTTSARNMVRNNWFDYWTQKRLHVSLLTDISFITQPFHVVFSSSGWNYVSPSENLLNCLIWTFNIRQILSPSPFLHVCSFFSPHLTLNCLLMMMMRAQDAISLPFFSLLNLKNKVVHPLFCFIVKPVFKVVTCLEKKCIWVAVWKDLTPLESCTL